MTVQQTLLTRRTAHQWVPGLTVPEDVLTAALEAAHHAPCHKLTWPWRFLRVGAQTRAALTEIGVALKVQTDDQMPEARRRAIAAKFQDPAALIVVTRVCCDDAFQAREDYAAVACAVQNFALSLHAEGWHTKWATGGVTRHPRTYAALDVNAGVEAIEGFLWVGQARVLPEITRPPLATVVRHLP